MGVSKTPVYITFQKATYDKMPKVVNASSQKPLNSANSNGPRVVLKLEVEMDDSLFDQVVETNTVISVGGKASVNPKQKKITVEPEEVVAGLREVNKAMKEI